MDADRESNIDPTDDPELFVQPEEPAGEQVDGPIPTDAADAGGSGRRGLGLVIGSVLLIIGLGAAAAAIYTSTTDEPTKERRVGKLVETLGPDEPSDESPDETADEATTTQPGGSTAQGGDAAGGLPPHWPFETDGRPAAFGKRNDPPPAEAPDYPPGFYLWQDFDGWHLWMVGGTADDRVTLTTAGSIAKVEPTGGDVAVETTDNTIAFSRGGATEPVVGIDFNPGYYTKTIIVATESEQLRVHLGRHRKATPVYTALVYGP